MRTIWINAILVLRPWDRFIFVRRKHYAVHSLTLRRMIGDALISELY